MSHEGSMRQARWLHFKHFPSLLIPLRHTTECNPNAILFALGFHSGTDSGCAFFILNKFVGSQSIRKVCRIFGTTWNIRTEFGNEENSGCSRYAFDMHSVCFFVCFRLAFGLFGMHSGPRKIILAYRTEKNRFQFQHCCIIPLRTVSLVSCMYSRPWRWSLTSAFVSWI